MENSLQLTYYGTNCLFFRKGETSLLVDPHFTRPALLRLLAPIRPRPEKITAGLEALGVRRLDGVLLTHTHYDHALDAAETVRQTGATLYGSPSAAQLAAGSGLEEGAFRAIRPGETVQIGTFTVQAHPGRHIQFPAPLGGLMSDSDPIQTPLQPPAWFWQYRCGAVYALQVDRVLVLGSAGLVPGAYRGLDVDAVVLSIGGLGLRPASYLERLYQEVVIASGARQVWVSHWDNFFRPVSRPLRPLGRAGWTMAQLQALAGRHGQGLARLPFNHPIDLVTGPKRESTVPSEPLTGDAR